MPTNLLFLCLIFTEEKLEPSKYRPYFGVKNILNNFRLLVSSHEEAGHLLSGLDWKGAVEDIQGAVNYLNSKGVNKVGIVGFCMGGALSIAASVFVEGIHAAAPFYGIPKPELLECDASKARAPLQLHFGTKDSAKGFSDPEAQDKLEKILKDSGRDYVFYRYEGAEHAFANEKATGGNHIHLGNTKNAFMMNDAKN